MNKPDMENNFREEVKKEFQLERMILFSDAVFAIVITLMAIEIKLPETEGEHGMMGFEEMVKHLAPVMLAYAVSFFFVGTTWYQHLRIFGLLKTYDKGLVIRNLCLLFCVGLFPFGATVIARGSGSVAAFYIYTGIIFLCLVAQFFIQYYILVQKPGLRNDTDISGFMEELRRRKISLAGFFVAIVLITITNNLVSDPHLKPLAMLWAALIPISMKLVKKKK